jgi:hypothetical protein
VTASTRKEIDVLARELVGTAIASGAVGLGSDSVVSYLLPLARIRRTNWTMNVVSLVSVKSCTRWPYLIYFA